MKIQNEVGGYTLDRVWDSDVSFDVLNEKIGSFVLNDSYNEFEYLNGIHDGVNQPIELIRYKSGTTGFGLELTSTTSGEDIHYVIVLTADHNGMYDNIDTFYTNELDLAYDALVGKML